MSSLLPQVYKLLTSRNEVPTVNRSYRDSSNENDQHDARSCRPRTCVFTMLKCISYGAPCPVCLNELLHWCIWMNNIEHWAREREKKYTKINHTTVNSADSSHSGPMIQRVLPSLTGLSETREEKNEVNQTCNTIPAFPAMLSRWRI